MLDSLDRAFYRLERAVVVGSLAAMALMVTLDVLYRRLVVDYGWGQRMAMAGVAYILISFAARTVKAPRPWSWALGVLVGLFVLTRVMLQARSAWTYIVVLAIAATTFGSRMKPRWRASLAVATGAVSLVLWKSVPEGFSWSKEVSLALLLWVGFLGASMATYDRRHISIDFIRRLVPDGARNVYECISHMIAAAFTAFLAFLSFRYVFGQEIGLYHLGGRFDHSGLPTWLGVAVVPLALATMTLRFVGHAVAAAIGRLRAAQSAHE